MSVLLRRNWVPAALLAGFLGMLYWIGTARAVRDWYVSPTGSGTACTIGSPCSLFSIIVDTGPTAGDTVWMRGGTYALTGGKNFEVYRSGTASAPIIFRNYNYEKVIVDCNGFNNGGSCIGTHGGSADYGAYVWFWGIRQINSATTARTGTAGGYCTGCYPPTMADNIFSATGSKVIYCNFQDAIEGALLNVGSGKTWGSKEIYGSQFLYSGFVGTDGRSHGHSLYLKNPYANGEAGRTYITNSVGLRAFDVDTQLYSAGSDPVSYVTFDGYISAAAGHAVYPTFTWPATGSVNNLYIGNIGALADCSNSRIAYADGLTNSVTYGGNGTTWGAGKGSCNSTITNNYFAEPSSIGFTTGATWAPLTITGNVFQATPDGSGGPALTFTQAHYPNNTYGLQAGNFVRYFADTKYEPGRGHVAIHNRTLAANLTIDLDQMGAYPGEQYEIYNWQGYDPGVNTPLASGTCGTPCGTVSVPSTLAAGQITQPGLTTDGSTPFPKPPDLGPEFVVYYLWDTHGATAPTPTNTFTPSNTATFTPSQTPTQTFTPSVTFTPTATSTASPTPSLTPTQTFTPSATPTPNPTPPANQNSFSVTSCTATLPMVVQVDAGAFGGYSASSITSNYGKLECPFNVASDGLYRVWTYVNGPSPLEDSFYLDVNGDSLPDGMTDGDTTNPHIFDIAEGKQPCTGTQSCGYVVNRDIWFWNQMNDRTATCGDCSGNFTERDLTLTAGANTLSFRTRDHNSKIAWIFVTNDFGFDPNQSPLPPTATPTPTPTGTITPAPSNTPTSTGTITAVPTSTPTRTPLPGTCRKWIQCNGKGAFIEAPCSQIKNRRPPIPCPW